MPGKIFLNAGNIEEMRYKRGAECGEFADQIVSVFERIWLLQIKLNLRSPVYE